MKCDQSSELPHAFNRRGNRSFATLLAAAALLGLTHLAGAQTYSLSNTWAQLPSTPTLNNLDTANNERAMCYYAPSNLVLVNNKSTHVIAEYDAVAGATNGAAVNITGVSGGTFTLNKMGVGTDGILYGANLNTAISSSSFYKLYAWTNLSTPPANPYSSLAGSAALVNLSGKRIGDSFAITGGGASTMILAGILNSSTFLNDFLLLSTADGVTWTDTVLSVSGIPSGGGGVQFGFFFYTNNTFIVAPNAGSTLYLVQFPANFATQSSPVACTVLASNTLSGGPYWDFSYNPAAGLLAAHPNAQTTSSVKLFDLPTNSFAAASVLATTNLSFSTSQTINGNETGDIALGGAGFTNAIFTFDSNAGLQATTISFTPAPVPPAFGTPLPAGGTVYTNINSFTFTVTLAGGSQPIYYQWYVNSVSNAATATPILNATNASYTVTPLPVTASGWYDVVASNSALSVTSAPVQLNVLTPLANVSVTPLWSLAADNSAPYLDTSYGTRGLAFDPISMNVLLAEHSGDNIYALNATNGQLNFLLTGPTTGLPSGSLFEVGQVGVADDGVVYVCNVSSYNPDSDTAVSGSTDFAITGFYSVANYTNADGSLNTTNLFPAFTGDPGAYMPGNPGSSSQDRWGDSMAVRGGGTNTEILLGTYETISSGGVNEYGTGSGTNVAILTTTDGVDFTPTTITVTNAPSGFAYLGVAWGQGNTFWAKSPGYDLREVQYDLNSGYGWVILDFSTTASSGSLSSVCGIGLDVSNNILAGVNVGDDPNDLELFQIPSLGQPPQAYFQAFFPAYNPNINGNAATSVKFPYIFSLDANNGIIGLKYSVPLLPFGIVNTYANKQQIFTWQTIIGHSYQLEATNALTGATNDWPHVGPAISATSSGTLSYTNNSFGGRALFYRVVAQ